MTLLDPDRFGIARDAFGTPLSRAKLHVFGAGSDIYKPIYQDPDLTATQQNPLPADDSGQFALAYLEPGTYRVVLQDQHEHIVSDEDGVFVAQSDYTFPDTAGFLAGRTLSYAPAPGQRQTAEAAVVRTAREGHVYVIAAQTATDHHVETASGVKAYILPQANGYYAIGAFGIAADGSDETAAILAAVDTGLDLDWGGVGNVFGTTAPLVMHAGQRFRADGATITALAVMPCVIQRASNTHCAHLRINANNIQPLSGVPLTQVGARAGMYFGDVLDTTTQHCEFTRHLIGVEVVSTGLGNKCGGHDFVDCVARVGFVWSGAQSSNHQHGAYVGSIATPQVTDIAGFTAPLMSECEDVFDIRFINWRSYEGQYGLALHRCSNVSVVNGSFREMSRAISIQQQARGIIVQGCLFQDVDSTGVHIAYGSQQVSVLGNRFKGTLQNDNAFVQGYFGVRDILVSGNHFDSRFDTWTGGLSGELRRPGDAIRFGQQAQDITLENNTIRGFLRGINLKTSIFDTTMLPSNPNYFNSGLRNIKILGNVIAGDYYTPATTYRAEMTTSQTYGLQIVISGAWEDTTQGSWDIEGVLIENNKVENAGFSFVAQSVAMSGGTVPAQYADFAVRLRGNISKSAHVGPVYRDTVSRPIAVLYEGNSWSDEQIWTPELVGTTAAGAQGYAVQTGSWSVRGRFILVRGQISLSSKDPAMLGDAVIAGLPARVQPSSGSFYAGTVSRWSDAQLPAGYTALACEAETNSQRLALVMNQPGGGFGSLSAAEVANTTALTFACSYEAG